jgi:hypothetical protein
MRCHTPHEFTASLRILHLEHDLRAKLRLVYGSGP